LINDHFFSFCSDQIPCNFIKLKKLMFQISDVLNHHICGPNRQTLVIVRCEAFGYTPLDNLEISHLSQ